MVAVCVCAAFSGITGFGLSLALVEGWGWGSGIKFLALGVIGLVGVVSRPLRTV